MAIKLATGVGQPNDSDFESTFADLAHAQLRDKAPALLDYLLGFQVIEANDDQTHAVGVLGFKVGEQTMFVPAFFLNGELKQNLIYIKNQDIFVPLQDNWITYLLNRRPFSMGEADPGNETELGIMQPDLSRLSNTMSGRNMSSQFAMRQASWQPWLTQNDMMMMFGRAPNDSRYEKLASLAEFLEKTAEYGTNVSLLGSMKTDPVFGNCVLSMYDIEDLWQQSKSASPATATDVDLMRYKQEAKHRKKKKSLQDAARLRGVYPPNEPKSALLRGLGKEAVDPTAQVRIYYGSQPDKILPERDMEALARGEMVIKDAREDTNQAFAAEGDFKLTNPTDCGSHELLLADGEYADVYIDVAPRSVGRGYVRTALVIDKESKSFGYWWPEQLWVRPYEVKRDDETSWINGLAAVTSVTPNSTYAIVSRTGKTSVAFKVLRKNSGQDGKTELYVEPIVSDPGTKPHQGTIYNDEETTQFGDGSKRPYVGDVTSNSADEQPEDTSASDGIPFGDMKHIVLCDDDRQMRLVRNTLFVSKNDKVVTLKPGGTKLESWGLHDPMSVIDVEMNLLKAGAEQFCLLKRSSDYFVDNQGPYQKVPLIVALVKKAGLSGDEAQLVVNGLRENKRSRFLVKNAIGYAPPFPEPQRAFDEYSGATEEYPLDEVINLNMPVGQEDYKYMGKPEKHQIMDAVNTGQKEIFDTSAIASLVRTSDSDDLISQYLSDIILGADRVNRILFMFYWLNEQFRDRYGQENLVEMEDQLKNVSKSLGDLILFLKQRQVEGSPSFDAMEVELGSK